MWIRLIDRKPSPGQLCLVVAPSGDPDMPLRQMSFWSHYDGFINLAVPWTSLITHWQPYPELPEELGGGK